MSTATDIDPPGFETSTASNFQSQLLHLIGEPFLFLARGYGGELILHFGEKLSDPFGKRNAVSSATNTVPIAFTFAVPPG